MNKALVLYEEGDYNASSAAWTEAFSYKQGFANDYYNAACTYSLANSLDNAVTALETSILRGWSDIDWLKKDSDFDNLRKHKNWDDFINKIPYLIEQRESKANIELKSELERLRKEDQVIRLLLPDAEKKFGRESDEYNWFRNELMLENDQKVLDKVVKIIDENGWLGISEVGVLGNQAQWLVIQHAPLKIQKKYLPVLKASVDKGESRGEHYAFLIDRILMRENKKQIYGTQARWDTELKKNMIYPIENPKEVNVLRISVGLNSIEEYARSSGYLYDQ